MMTQSSEFLEWMLVHNYSERTVDDRREHLNYFIWWCEERGILRASEVTKPVLVCPIRR
jgi:integrase/recombinase XerD